MSMWECEQCGNPFCTGHATGERRMGGAGVSRWINAAADLALTFFVKMPLIVLVALPAFCIGYAWTIAAGAFLWGIAAHEREGVQRGE